MGETCKVCQFLYKILQDFRQEYIRSNQISAIWIFLLQSEKDRGSYNLLSIPLAERGKHKWFRQ